MAGGAVARRGVEGSNVGSHMEMAKPPVLNGEVGKVGELIIACRLYLRVKMREAAVEEQIQWVLSYVQRGSVNIWKKNMLEDLKGGLLEYGTIGEFLTDIKKEFGGGDEESVKVAELKKVEQGEKIMEEFVQEFRRAARGSIYKRRLLIEEFKKEMKNLIEAEKPPTSIEQWYKHATNLDRY